MELVLAAAAVVGNVTVGIESMLLIMERCGR
jgi:hypothetical protein